MSQRRQLEYSREIYFKNRYRIPSARMRGWDYAREGYYFVTICVKDRLACLAKIFQGEVHLSPIGEIITEEWEKTAEIRKNVELDAWIIMPDHVHGIIGIVHPKTINPEIPRRENDKISGLEIVETPRRGVSTPTTAANAAWKRNSLGSILGQFKSKTTKRICAAGYFDFAWQTRFYDHIIRDRDDLDRIRRYIQENPTKWEMDRNRIKKGTL